MEFLNEFIYNFFAYYGELLTFAKVNCFSPFYGDVINMIGTETDPMSIMFVFFFLPKSFLKKTKYFKLITEFIFFVFFLIQGIEVDERTCMVWT